MPSRQPASRWSGRAADRRAHAAPGRDLPRSRRRERRLRGSAVGSVIDRFGRIDVLVNNAGIGAAGAVEDNSVAQAQRVLDTNVVGVIRMTKAVLPHMRAQGSGRIINVSSVLGVAPQPFMAIYVASKHAIEGYSESLDHEVREHGIRVILVQPAYTKTDFDANAAQPTPRCPCTPSVGASSTR